MRLQAFLTNPIIPAESAPEGIRYDFNDGVRVLFPNGTGAHDVTLSNAETGELLQEAHVCDGGKFRSRIRFFVPWILEVRNSQKKVIFSHKLDLAEKEVLLDIASDALGDSIAWFSYAERFALRHRCRLGVVMNPKVADIFQARYPQITFFNRQEMSQLAPYATYRLGVKYHDDGSRQRKDYHEVSLDELAAWDLGMQDQLRSCAPMVELFRSSTGEVKTPHICVAFQASMRQKEWQNPDGWNKVVEFFQKAGYRVICIDRNGTELHGAEDYTGDRPLSDRIATLRTASLFIGGPSGLAWLAWATGTPVVMISGFSEPWAEMPCRRVQNTHVCHGCWNDKRVEFVHGKDWCPRRKHHECTRAITGAMVIDAALKELKWRKRK